MKKTKHEHSDAVTVFIPDRKHFDEQHILGRENEILWVYDEDDEQAYRLLDLEEAGGRYFVAILAHPNGDFAKIRTFHDSDDYHLALSREQATELPLPDFDPETAQLTGVITEEGDTISIEFKDRSGNVANKIQKQETEKWTTSDATSFIII